jgi:hypothetical protein
MVEFENGTLVNQIVGNYGMSEVYVETFSGALLFLSCVASITIAHSTFGRDILHRGFLIRSLIISRRYEGIKMTEPGLLGWQTISAAILYTGLIGLGESMRHLFENPLMVNFFQVISILAAPIALHFFYLGIRKHIKREYDTVILPLIVWGTVAFLYAAAVLAIFASYYEGIIEVFFYLALFPVLALAGLLMGMAFKSYSKHVVFIPGASMMGMMTALLVISMLIERMSIMYRAGDIYIVAQVAKDILLSMTAASVLIYTGATQVAMKHLSEGSPRTGEQTRKPLLSSILSKRKKRF